MCAPQIRCSRRRLRSLVRFAAGILLAVLAGIGVNGQRHRPSRVTPLRCMASRRCPADFTHLRYANPDAPKGGRLVQGVLGTFDSLNPFIVQGLPAQGMRAPLVSGSNIIGGYVVESLMARGYDEPFTLYGLVARTVETDDARSYVTFTLDPAARFSDGKPVTAEDVHLLLAAPARPGPAQPPLLLRQGRKRRSDRRPRGALRSRRQQRPRAAADPRPDAGPGEARGQSRDVRGNLAHAARSAADPTLSARSIRARASRSRATRTIGGATFRSIAASGISTRSASTITATPIRYHEAFKRGLFDVRTENDPGRWQTGYDFPALRDGRVVKETFSSGLPKPSFFFVFNTRRPIFADIPRARGARAAVRFRMGQPQPVLRPLPAHRKLLRRLRAVRASGGRPTRASARCWRRFPTRCAPTCSTAPGRRR